MSIKREWFDRDVAMIKEHWFPGHVPQIIDIYAAGPNDSVIQSLVWAKPGTSTYYVRYLLFNSTLVVTGDIGYAIYRWGRDPDMGFSWIAKCDFHYFSEKIEGLENSHRRSETWRSDVCEKRVIDFLHQKERRPGKLSNWRSCTVSAEEWARYVYDNHKVLDEMDACGWGYVPSIRCIGHWMGLRMALGIEKA